MHYWTFCMPSLGLQYHMGSDFWGNLFANFAANMSLHKYDLSYILNQCSTNYHVIKYNFIKSHECLKLLCKQINTKVHFASFLWNFYASKLPSIWHTAHQNFITIICNMAIYTHLKESVIWVSRFYYSVSDAKKYI